MGINRDGVSHRHPLITFLSFLVNARCILLIETTMFITGNGLRARKRKTEKGSGGRERRRQWRDRRAFSDEELDSGTFISACSLILSGRKVPWGGGGGCSWRQKHCHTVAPCCMLYHLSLRLSLSSCHRARSKQQKTTGKRPPASASICILCLRDIYNSSFRAMHQGEQI